MYRFSTLSHNSEFLENCWETERVSHLTFTIIYFSFPELHPPNLILRSQRVSWPYKTGPYCQVGSRSQYILFLHIFDFAFSALLGAVHIDRNPKGIKYCQKIIEVSLLSRLNVRNVLFVFIFKLRYIWKITILTL